MQPLVHSVANGYFGPKPTDSADYMNGKNPSQSSFLGVTYSSGPQHRNLAQVPSLKAVDRKPRELVLQGLLRFRSD